MIYKISLLAGRFTDVNVDTSNVLGKGAEASVYKAFIGKKLHAAKIFHDAQKVGVEKIQAMIINPPTNLTGETAGIKYPRYAWPISLIFDSAHKPIGFRAVGCRGYCSTFRSDGEAVPSRGLLQCDGHGKVW